MRLFIAVEPSKEVKDYLYNLENNLKSKLPASVRWVSKKNLHLTLKFLGEISESKLEKLKETLSEIQFKPFELSLEKLGYFGTSKEIYTLWLKVIPELELTRLAQLVDSETLTFSSSDQKFTSHLTLGRVNKLKNMQEFKSVIEKFETEKLKFKVESFYLIQSNLTKDGPQYKILQEFRL